MRELLDTLPGSASGGLLDGKKVSAELRATVAGDAERFFVQHGRKPGLRVVLVGDDPASVVYTRNKEKAAREAGIEGALHRLPADSSTEQVLAVVAALDADDTVDGILVQLPLPKQIDAERVLRAVSPAKDVDGFHPENVGLLASGTPRLIPCTPKGCMTLLRATGVSLTGAVAVVIGRSTIVGKPMAQLLLQENATVTIAHSKTRDLPELCRTADLLVAAVGRAEMVRGDWIKEGAIVLDVGINRVSAADPNDPDKTKLVGDVAFDEARTRARWITPVPGGVGPMTIAELLANTVHAAELRRTPRP